MYNTKLELLNIYFFWVIASYSINLRVGGHCKTTTYKKTEI
jgi:hypothetical protein